MTDIRRDIPPMPSIHPAPDTPGMSSLESRWLAALPFDRMVAEATANVELYENFRKRAVAPPEYAARIAATGTPWRLLVISEDWCGDSVNIVPWLDALAESAPDVELRILPRDAHLDLMDAHLTDGRSRAIPIALLLDEGFVEHAWWGPRTAELQAWFRSAEAQALTKDERYKELRLRYARDRGRAIMEEVTTMIERAAAQRSATSPSHPASA
jgi:arginase family enzyme